MGRAFNRFWGAYCLSNFADGLLMTGLPLIAATMTSDPLQVSALLTARFLPWLLFGVAAGALADRIDRSRAIAVANAVRGGALIAAALVLAAGHGGIWLLYAAMFVVIGCETVYESAAKAMVPTLVPPGRLDRANGRLEGGRVVTEDFAGSPAAGVLMAVGAAAPLFANAGGYLLAAAVLLLLPTSPAAAAPMREGAEPRPSFRRDVAAGLRFLWSDRVQRANVAYNIATMTALPMATSVLVLVVQQVFGVPAALYGVFMAGSAVGALASAALTARLADRWGRTRVFAVAMAALAASLLGLGTTGNPVAAAALWAVFGAALTASNIVREALFQSITPNRLLGRATSTRRMFAWGAAALGAPAGGLLGRIDLQLPLLAAGALLAAALLCYLPAFRRAAARAASAEQERKAPEDTDPRRPTDHE
ncbi:MFS transporter [Nocardiopsis potens]|uniref:MFS transporter n=1 Tax=Nocardiopsis potens TaxID=1246458 RepID=UPI00034CD353|nr:MFS transporter [Nocardiopsis potens]